MSQVNGFNDLNSDAVLGLYRIALTLASHSDIVILIPEIEIPLVRDAQVKGPELLFNTET